MTEISHFLESGGWKITRRTKGVCTTMFPKNGMILIGHGETKGECCLAWVDGSNCLLVVERLQRQKDEWKGTFTKEGKEYWITVKGVMTVRGKSIGGKIGLVEKGRVQSPPVGYSTTGTWGAESGGGGGTVPPPGKDKPAGSGASVPS